MAPQNIQVTPLTASQLEVTWDPPPPESQNGNIQGYKASWWGWLFLLLTVCPTEARGFSWDTGSAPGCCLTVPCCFLSSRWTADTAWRPGPRSKLLG